MSSTKYGIVVGILINIFIFSYARAQTVAVFPVADLTYGDNGVNFEISKQIADELVQKNVDVISGAPVVSFMAKNRIRWVGILDTNSILLANNDLGADFVLYGTSIKRRQESSAPAIGLTLYLVRSTDGRIIWSNSSSLSPGDEQHLLGLNQPETIQDLMSIVVSNILSGFPEQQDFEANSTPVFNIERAELYPKYVKPGEQVHCSVFLRTYEPNAGKYQVFVKAGNRIHVAMNSSDSQFYQASWQGDPAIPTQANAVSSALSLAMESPDPQIYSTQIKSDKDGSYPVTLVIKQPNGIRKVVFLGSYHVDGTPPDLSLELKGTKLDGMVTFRDKVLILPQMKQREPVTHWLISVDEQSGIMLMSQKGKGSLPQRFYWNGRDSNNNPVGEGIYNIILDVWDRAGNSSSATQQVKVSRSLPQMHLTAKSENNEIDLTINSQGDIPIAFWHIEFWTNKGEFLKTVEGDDLPAEIQVPTDIDQESEKISCSLVVRDILGNQTKKQVKDLKLLAELDPKNDHKKSPEKKAAEKAWMDGF